MSDVQDNSPELIQYRFIDDASPEEAPKADPRVVAVEYFASVEDAAIIAEKISRQLNVRSRAQVAFQIFFVGNTVFAPALLIYSDLFPLAISLFLFNFLFAAIILPDIVKNDYRRFFRTTDPKLENEVVRVELRSDGVQTQRRGDFSFHEWSSVVGIEETKDAIFLYLLGARGIPVRKSGFAYESQKDEFLAFARSRVNENKLLNDPGNS
jgi:hypothetical protein